MWFVHGFVYTTGGHRMVSDPLEKGDWVDTDFDWLVVFGQSLLVCIPNYSVVDPNRNRESLLSEIDHARDPTPSIQERHSPYGVRGLYTRYSKRACTHHTNLTSCGGGSGVVAVVSDV
jgi:hypothetical protein